MSDEKLLNMSKYNFIESKNYSWNQNVIKSLNFFKSNNASIKKYMKAEKLSYKEVSDIKKIK